jgi:predicted ATP-binding protein involved in virulence
VLVAENGRGKTAVLDAIAIALGLFVDIVAHTRQGRDFDTTDVRRIATAQGEMVPVLPTQLVAEGYVDGRKIRWSRMRKRVDSRSRPKIKQLEDLRQAAQHLRERVGSYVADGGDPPTLPLVAYYGTQRLWSEERRTQRISRYSIIDSIRLSGYSSCLSSSSSVKDVVSWYEAKMKEVGAPGSSHIAVQVLTGVEKAMRVVLKPTGWHRLLWDSEQQRLIVEHPDQGRLPPSALSDGVRTMLALVMDIARRCTILNPHLSEEAASQTPGVLLIDEIDMHLHPGWQQQVVDLLREAFPLMQIVLSTHSPHVLSTVDSNSIRIIRLRDGQGLLKTPELQTRGVESADVLATIMDVDPIPAIKETQWVRDYNALIQQHLFDTPEARALRSQLEEHFGVRHPVILECDRLIRLERFKKTLPPLKEKRD